MKQPFILFDYHDVLAHKDPLTDEHVPEPAMIEFVQMLKNNKVRIGLATNMPAAKAPATQQQYPSLFKLFDFMFFATEHSGQKPRESYFIHLYKELHQTHNLQEFELFFIDDKYVHVYIGKQVLLQQYGLKLMGIEFKGLDQTKQLLYNTFSILK
jgi:FMN phosphatase YigB (HAD superfamily)